MNQIVKRNQHALAVKGKLAELFGDSFAEDAGDLTGGVSVGFDVLSIKGKTFHIKSGGEATLVMNPNDPDEPATSLNVVLLKANPHISKVYYENGYEDGADTKPTCYSNNGVAPEDDSEEKQSPRCATCPKNQWGSRVTDNGKKGKACSDSRRVAIAPAGEPDHPMLLRVPAASLKPLMQYGKALAQRGVPYQAVITKLSFDHSVAHPLLKFAPAAALQEDDAPAFHKTMTGDVVEAILNGGGAEAITPDELEDEDEGEQFEQVAAQAKAVAAKKATPPKPTPKPKAAAAEVTAAAVADIVGEQVDESEEQPEPPKVEAKKPTTAKATNTAASKAANAPVVDGDVDSMLGDLLGEFDGE